MEKDKIELGGIFAQGLIVQKQLIKKGGKHLFCHIRKINNMNKTAFLE
jgi:NAD-dependent oxidoreductase involved in siderophore biosynthesis